MPGNLLGRGSCGWSFLKPTEKFKFLPQVWVLFRCSRTKYFLKIGTDRVSSKVFPAFSIFFETEHQSPQGMKPQRGRCCWFRLQAMGNETLGRTLTRAPTHGVSLFCCFALRYKAAARVSKTRNRKRTSVRTSCQGQTL